jgi:hypothetical protein
VTPSLIPSLMLGAVKLVDSRFPECQDLGTVRCSEMAESRAMGVYLCRRPRDILPSAKDAPTLLPPPIF